MVADGDPQRSRVLRTVLEAAPVGIGLVHRRTLGWCNARLEQMLGYTAAELAGQSARILYPDEAEFERVAREKHPRIAAGGVGSVETRMRRKDGTILPVLLSSAALDAGDLDAGLIYTVLDLTEQHRAEERLVAQQRAQARLLANLPGMAYRCRNDAHWTMEYLSGGCPALTGRPVEAFLGNAALAYADILHPEDRDRVWQQVQEALRLRDSFEVEYRIDTPDGEKWVWERGRGVHDNTGELVALEGFITDITDRKALEERARQSQRLEAIGRLAGGIAHDFNNILQVINGYATMLADDLRAGSADPEQATEIRRAGDRASTLVRQLLAFSRQQVLRRTDVDVNLLTAHLLAMLERMIGEHITLVFQDDPGVGLVHADPSQLEQALVNLCLNAREAMPDGGRLEITTADVQLATADCEQIVGTSPGRHVRLTVTDTGHGMPPEVAAQACEPFFTTKGVGEGSGLGLPSVYGIIQQHGGGLTVRSRPGQGTSVDLYLPVRATTTAVRESPAAADELAGEETILVAEDDPGVRQLTCQLLANSGYQVLTARDGHEALAVFAQHAADLDLALLDVVMPGGGGREVHDAIRRTAPDLPILFCTGYDLDVVHPGFTPGAATAVLQKPFGGRELLRQVRTLLPPAAP